MRERRTHGSVRGLRREPLVYSTVGKFQAPTAFIKESIVSFLDEGGCNYDE